VHVPSATAAVCPAVLSVPHLVTQSVVVHAMTHMLYFAQSDVVLWHAADCDAHEVVWHVVHGSPASAVPPLLEPELLELPLLEPELLPPSSPPEPLLDPELLPLLEPDELPLLEPELLPLAGQLWSARSVGHSVVHAPHSPTVSHAAYARYAASPLGCCARHCPTQSWVVQLRAQISAAMHSPPVCVAHTEYCPAHAG
jgi:hypothetical protein